MYTRTLTKFPNHVHPAFAGQFLLKRIQFHIPSPLPSASLFNFSFSFFNILLTQKQHPISSTEKHAIATKANKYLGLSPVLKKKGLHIPPIPLATLTTAIAQAFFSADSFRLLATQDHVIAPPAIRPGTYRNEATYRVMGSTVAAAMMSPIVERTMGTMMWMQRSERRSEE